MTALSCLAAVEITTRFPKHWASIISSNVLPLTDGEAGTSHPDGLLPRFKQANKYCAYPSRVLRYLLLFLNTSRSNSSKPRLRFLTFIFLFQSTGDATRADKHFPSFLVLGPCERRALLPLFLIACIREHLADLCDSSGRSRPARQVWKQCRRNDGVVQRGGEGCSCADAREGSLRCDDI